jgi:hypothetical protein
MPMSAFNGGVDEVDAALRSAVAAVRDGAYRQAATALLIDEHGPLSLSVRRWNVAEAIGMSPDTFRRRYEPRVLHEVAYRLGEITASTAEVRTSGGTVVPGRAAPSQVPDPHSATELLAKVAEGVDNAVMLIGSFLLVKSAGKVVGRTLTAAELDLFAERSEVVMTNTSAALAFVIDPTRSPDELEEGDPTGPPQNSGRSS